MHCRLRNFETQTRDLSEIPALWGWGREGVQCATVHCTVQAGVVVITALWSGAAHPTNSADLSGVGHLFRSKCFLTCNRGKVNPTLKAHVYDIMRLSSLSHSKPKPRFQHCGVGPPTTARGPGGRYSVARGCFINMVCTCIIRDGWV